MKKTDSKLLIAAVLLAVAILAFAILKSGDKEEEPAPEPALRIEDVEGIADDSGSMWELMCRLFPDYVIYKDSKGHFTYSPINKELAQNTYDWSSLAGTIRGIDVSYYQGKISWDKLKTANVNYAIIRVGYRGYTQGTFAEDKMFETNIVGALQNDIPVGVYMVTKALNKEEGAEEADFILEKIKPYNITWPVVIDIEPTSNANDRTANLTASERTDAVLAFCDRIREAGYTPMIYGSVGTFMNYLEFERLEGIEKWFAQYFNAPFLRYEFGIWQASDQGKLPGINGNVDINYSIKDYGAQ